TAFERSIHPGLERMVGALERQHQNRRRTVPCPRVMRLLRVEDPAVGGVKARLGDRLDGAGSREEIRKAHRAARTAARTVREPHPGFGYYPEDPFRTDEQAVGARPRPGTGQAPGLERTARCDHPQAFDEVVNMRVKASEMAA